MTDYCDMCQGFGYYPLGTMNAHPCRACKSSGFRAEFIVFLPWSHPAIRMWVETLPPNEPINVRQIMGLPRPVFDPKVHGPDALPMLRKRRL